MVECSGSPISPKIVYAVWTIALRFLYRLPTLLIWKLKFLAMANAWQWLVTSESTDYANRNIPCVCVCSHFVMPGCVSLHTENLWKTDETHLPKITHFCLARLCTREWHTFAYAIKSAIHRNVKIPWPCRKIAPTNTNGYTQGWFFAKVNFFPFIFDRPKSQQQQNNAHRRCWV